MDIINITDYVNMSNDNNDTNNNNDNIMTIEISYLFLITMTIPCFLSLICCFSLSIYSFIKFLKK